MQYLLDTHTLLWFLEGDKQLPAHIKKEIENTNNDCFVSIASLWEIAIKSSIEKLTLQFPFDNFSFYLIKNRIDILPITFNHLQKLLQLEPHHKDPFDRIIIAQAITEKITVISRDKNFSNYLVGLVWNKV